ncbi:unnamed protein product [Adineta steineri]|uniref:Uncharacterized protein n=1 Tax=Adineta steineri TaxID=433720 RepID=A0A813W9M1_9BILA|nr:unnamed protein product [Adineta steineri]CAF1390886.1 unnamed protein product [Adineta steineri]
MSNEVQNILKTKLVKKRSTSKPSASINSQPLRNRSKPRNKRSKSLASKISHPPVHYHPWQFEYSRLYIREKSQKSMTKDSYPLPIRSVAHAIERIATEEECYPKLIPANAIHIEIPIIHQKRKSSLPSIVRYVRGNELFPSQRSIPHTRLQYQSKTSFPIINPTKINTLAPTKIHVDASIIRRPPRRLILNTSYRRNSSFTIYN